MTLKYRPAAIADIQNVCGYIRDKLKNPKAANNLKSRILCGASLLKDSPYMGTPLDSRYEGLETDLQNRINRIEQDDFSLFPGI